VDWSSTVDFATGEDEEYCGLECEELLGARDGQEGVS